ncbi:MAG TPA: NUDIX domain-containing protein [Candidatus Nitrosotalea sp.]|nr:NUDIX domain-containing protein [Candidatus Nitrosotalea sp.]
MGALELEYDDKDKVIIVDVCDNQVGTMPRTTAHHKNMLHRGIHLEIRKGKKVLICKRAAYKKIEPNKWDFSVSGHLDPNDVNSTDPDAYVNCVIREAKEELRITLEKENLKDKGKFELNTMCGENVMVKLFESTSDAENFTFNKDEISEIKWVDVKQLPKMARDNELTEWYDHIVSRIARKITE